MKPIDPNLLSDAEFEEWRFKQDDFADEAALKLLKLGDHTLIHQAIQHINNNEHIK